MAEARWLLLALTLGLAFAANAGDEPAERGAELLKPFKQSMKGALMEGLAEGPAAAIDACRLRAPAIAAELSTGGVQMGRSSHRLRNPANAGPAWVEATLARYVDDPATREPVLVELKNDRFGYIEPIVTQPMCLACHGAELAPAVETAIDELYPDDQATGFEAGDLRGIFWVEFAD